MYMIIKENKRSYTDIWYGKKKNHYSLKYMYRNTYTHTGTN